jgi:hypothetical protein
MIGGEEMYDTLQLPGWRELQREAARVTFEREGQPERVTLSKLELAKTPTLAEFEKLCQHRLDAERSVLQGDDNLQISPPADDLTMFFSGTESAAARLFSGFLFVSGQALITVYVEGVGVPPRQHLDSFRAVVTATLQAQ